MAEHSATAAEIVGREFAGAVGEQYLRAVAVGEYRGERQRMVLAFAQLARAGAGDPYAALALGLPRARIGGRADVQPVDGSGPRHDLAVDLDLGERPQLLARRRRAILVGDRGDDRRR